MFFSFSLLTATPKGNKTHFIQIKKYNLKSVQTQKLTHLTFITFYTKFIQIFLLHFLYVIFIYIVTIQFTKTPRVVI